MRPTAEKRHNDYKKAIRKRRIDRFLDGTSPYRQDYYDNLHQYSKNKIFCSCPLCACKSKNKGWYAYFYGTTNWNPHDRRQLDELDYEEEEEEE